VFAVAGMEAVYPASYAPHIGVQDLLSRVSNEVIVEDAKALHSTLGHQFDAVATALHWSRSNAEVNNRIVYDAPEPFIKAVTLMLQMAYHGVDAVEVRTTPRGPLNESLQ
jgi:hypothetical protein